MSSVRPANCWTCPACDFTNVPELRSCDLCGHATPGAAAQLSTAPQLLGDVRPRASLQRLLRDVNGASDALDRALRKRRLEGGLPSVKPREQDCSVDSILRSIEHSSSSAGAAAEEVPAADVGTAPGHGTEPPTGAPKPDHSTPVTELRTVRGGGSDAGDRGGDSPSDDASAAAATADGSRRILELVPSGQAAAFVPHCVRQRLDDAPAAPQPAGAATQPAGAAKRPTAIVEYQVAASTADGNAARGGRLGLQGPGASGGWMRLTYDPKKMVLQHEESGEQSKICGRVAQAEWDMLRNCETLAAWHAEARAVVQRAKTERRMWHGGRNSVSG
jgi:hypothetical protein|eukprot:3912398-Prymnesium_polylepis.1